MVCERCQGQGSLPFIHPLFRSRRPCGFVGKDISGMTFFVCPECNGSGTAHCCDGLREQPEDRPEDRP